MFLDCTTTLHMRAETSDAQELLRRLADAAQGDPPLFFSLLQLKHWGSVDRAQFENDTLVVEVWTSWCTPPHSELALCAARIPHINLRATTRAPLSRILWLAHADNGAAAVTSPALERDGSVTYVHAAVGDGASNTTSTQLSAKDAIARAHATDPEFGAALSKLVDAWARILKPSTSH